MGGSELHTRSGTEKCPQPGAVRPETADVVGVPTHSAVDRLEPPIPEIDHVHAACLHLDQVAPVVREFTASLDRPGTGMGGPRGRIPAQSEAVARVHDEGRGIVAPPSDPRVLLVPATPPARSGGRRGRPGPDPPSDQGHRDQPIVAAVRIMARFTRSRPRPARQMETSVGVAAASWISPDRSWRAPRGRLSAPVWPNGVTHGSRRERVGGGKCPSSVQTDLPMPHPWRPARHRSTSPCCCAPSTAAIGATRIARFPAGSPARSSGGWSGPCARSVTVTPRRRQEGRGANQERAMMGWVTNDGRAGSLPRGLERSGPCSCRSPGRWPGAWSSARRRPLPAHR